MRLSKRKAKERFSALIEVGFEGAVDKLEHELEDFIAERKVDKPAGDDLIELLPFLAQFLLEPCGLSPAAKISGRTADREN